MYNQTDLDRKERRRIISAVVAISAIILILVVAIVVVATKKSTRNSIANPSEENTSFEIADNGETTGEIKSEAEDESHQENNINIGTISTEKNTDTKSNETEQVIASSSVSAVESNDTGKMPNTGPEDFLPLALMAGTLVAYLSSTVIAKREA